MACARRSAGLRARRLREYAFCAAAGIAGAAAGEGGFTAVSLTVGSILVFVGLILVIVGAIRRSQIKKRGY